MSNQRRTIMGACDYSIETLKNLKRDMSQIGVPNSELIWAIGGLVCAMTSNLLQICHEVINETSCAEDGGAKEDIQKIQTKFNEFIERLINNV